MFKSSVKGYSVYDVYERPSIYKVKAENEILKEMEDLNGYGYHIISYNTCMFTCGYYYKDDLGRVHFVYHTKTRREDTILDSEV